MPYPLFMETTKKKPRHSEVQIESGWILSDSNRQKYNDYEYPRISIVIPTYNCAQSLRITIGSLLCQDYPDFEIVIVDGGSTDYTLEILKGYRDDRIHIFSFTGYQRYEMINKGISHASGLYINILFPGDFYIYRGCLKNLMTVALNEDKPNLVYCGALLRDSKSDIKTLYRKLDVQLLRRGQQPTSLQSCWFRSDTFSIIGKFDSGYALRGGFDLLCRYTLTPNLRTASLNRMLTDYDLRWVTRWMVVQHFWETMKTIYKYFGLLTVIQWFFTQKITSRFFLLWMRRIKVAFLGRG
jgi:glycosyltransferase involved in cell wall biosynthesis